MTRQTKTPTQRAQEAVDVLHRRLVKLRGKHREARDLVEDLDRQIEETELRLEYAENNPDLPNTPTKSTSHPTGETA